LRGKRTTFADKPSEGEKVSKTNPQSQTRKAKKYLRFVTFIPIFISFVTRVFEYRRRESRLERKIVNLSSWNAN
jgi:ribosomal protein S19